MWNQRQIVGEQLAAQRKEHELARSLTRQQIAAAFIGEIDVILDELRHEFLGPVLEKTLRDLETSPSAETQVASARIGSHFGRYFNSGPGNVGLFPSAISGDLTRFYTVLEEIRLGLDWYSSAVEAYTKQKTHIMSGPQMLGLLRKMVREIDSCLQLGPALISRLEAIRDAALD